MPHNIFVPFRRISIILAATLSFAAYGGQVTVITSFSKEITAVYKAAFEKKYSDIKVEVLNKNTEAAIDYIRSLPAEQRPDIFWASAPDAFEILARDNLLMKLTGDVGNAQIPSVVGGYPMNDPQDFYKGQALAGYGIVWNKPYLEERKLPPPAQWSDLTKAMYFGHVAMSSPSRSGTTHLTVETILQGNGWVKGWAELLEIAGNCAAITEKSFDVPNGVNSGKYGIGLVIDYLGLSGKYSGSPVEFAYPKINSIVPASIAIVAGSKNLPDAKRFVNYTLSKEGQELLFDPKISRLPALPETYISGKMPRDFPNIFQIARKSTLQFDPQISELRRPIVASMFDQMITANFAALQAAANAIHNAETKLEKKSNSKALALVKQARELAYTPVINEAGTTDQAILELFKAEKKDAASASKVSDLEGTWSAKAKANYEKAQKLATQAASMAK